MFDELTKFNVFDFRQNSRAYILAVSDKHKLNNTGCSKFGILGDGSIIAFRVERRVI